MDNGKVYLDDGCLFVFNHKLQLDMQYTDIINTFTNFIKSTKQLKDSNALVVELFDTYVYGIESNIYIYFEKAKISKIKMNLRAENITVVSEKTGIELYKEKLRQAVLLFKNSVIQQYFGANNSSKYYTKGKDDTLFNLQNDKYCFYNKFPKNSDGLICSAILKHVETK